MILGAQLLSQGYAFNAKGNSMLDVVEASRYGGRHVLSPACCTCVDMTRGGRCF